MIILRTGTKHTATWPLEKKWLECLVKKLLQIMSGLVWTARIVIY